MQKCGGCQTIVELIAIFFCMSYAGFNNRFKKIQSNDFQVKKYAST